MNSSEDENDVYKKYYVFIYSVIYHKDHALAKPIISFTIAISWYLRIYMYSYTLPLYIHSRDRLHIPKSIVLSSLHTSTLVQMKFESVEEINSKSKMPYMYSEVS